LTSPTLTQTIYSIPRIIGHTDSDHEEIVCHAEGPENCPSDVDYEDRLA
jgi:hypothetical protein